MKLITLDFETFYEKGYSLSAKGMTTEKCVRDPRFEVIGVSVKHGKNPTDWFSGTMKQTNDFLHSIDWKDKAVLAHNTPFDGSILAWHFGIKPMLWLDTISMARPLYGLEHSLKLEHLCEFLEIGKKGDEVVRAFGKHRLDFTPEELAKYGEYCINDTELTFKLFKVLVKMLPVNELKVIDVMLRMFIEPSFILNKDILEKHLLKVQLSKEELLKNVEKLAGKGALMSNQQLANILEALNVDVPMKLSPSALKRGEEVWTYAFSKDDPDFLALQEHENPMVQAIVTARLGVKSTLEETRTQRFIEAADRGPMPVPMAYYSAHTGRPGGYDKTNMLNLPRGGALRYACEAPEGYQFVAADSAQIEARIVAYLAGQDDLVEQFRNGEDVYSSFASEVYEKPIDRKLVLVNAQGKEYKPYDKEGRVGKECLTGDVRVFTNCGVVPLSEVTPEALVWDGVEWVQHEGLVCRGEKEVARFNGVGATPDHEILTGHGWRAWSEVHTNHSLFQSALSLAASPLQGGEGTLAGAESEHSKQRSLVYDLLNAGPRQRFTILTDSGPMIVSNSILGLGFGMGKDKFQKRLQVKANVFMDLNECTTVVHKYRSKYSRIAALWRQGGEALDHLYGGYTYELGEGIKLMCKDNRIWLPNGMFLHYPELRRTADGYRYTVKTGRKVEEVYIYGPKVIENIVQALARIVVAYQMLEISERYHIALHVYDENIALVKTEETEAARAFMESVMSKAPPWAPDLPIACESAVGNSYGACK